MNYKNNAHCYNFKSINYKDPLLKSIDATYILHLENNGRLQNIESQLEKYHPSNLVYIVFNKGYKKCKKTLKQHKTTFDLKDAYLNIFQHSFDNDHKNILILEDDFIFNEEIKDQYIRNNLDTYIEANKNEKLIYYLGIIPFINYFTSLKHLRILVGLGLHACIYTEPVKYYLLENADSVDDWDINISTQLFNIKRMRYITPLCYQTFPVTENSNNWKNTIYFGEYLYPIIPPTMKLLRLDTKPEPGFTIMYMFSYIFTIFVIYIIVIMLNKCYKLTKKTLFPIIKKLYR